MCSTTLGADDSSPWKLVEELLRQVAKRSVLLLPRSVISASAPLGIFLGQPQRRHKRQRRRAMPGTHAAAERCSFLSSGI